MQKKIESRQNGQSSVPLVVTNRCQETIYPGIVTQGGTGPSSGGFQLTPGSSRNQTVSNNWQGRVWGRTNCSFNNQGTAQGGGSACSTGDCGGTVNCQATGQTPVTLAEFTLDGGNSQTFYDISIVDGYNLPMAIVAIGSSNLPANEMNPSCVASVGDLAGTPFNPYSSGSFLGTTSQDPLPFDSKVTTTQVSSWCPWDLQSTPPTGPGNGVYPYPDTNIARNAFDPCLSACAKYDKPEYCCTGSYNGPNSCSPNYYAKAAKAVCPDAYSYAYDDQTSTFIISKGPGFQVIFCPGGRSTTIIAARSGQSGGAQSSGGSFRLAKSMSDPILDALCNSGRPMIAAVVAVLAARFVG
ncbi:hypothetical protein MBLNU457_3671t1 [Dothideomycetes sp. NU457]